MRAVRAVRPAARCGVCGAYSVPERAGERGGPQVIRHNPECPEAPPRPSRYVQTLQDEDMTPLEALAVAVMVGIFVAVESNGSCFDVLVRRAIEEGERT